MGCVSQNRVGRDKKRGSANNRLAQGLPEAFRTNSPETKGSRLAESLESIAEMLDFRQPGNRTVLRSSPSESKSMPNNLTSGKSANINWLYGTAS